MPQEAMLGDPDVAARRIALLADIPSPARAASVERLATRLLQRGAVPSQAAADAVHIANAQMTRRVAAGCAEAGFRCRVICTPEELMEEPYGRRFDRG